MATRMTESGVIRFYKDDSTMDEVLAHLEKLQRITTMLDTELKPCCFCDEMNAIVRFGVSMPFGAKNVHAEGFYIECQEEDCHACTLHQPTEEGAIKAWNSEDVWGYDV